MATSMITATAWVPRGFAAPFPTKYAFDEEEYLRIAQLQKLQLDDANEDLEEARNEGHEPKEDAAMAEEDGSEGDAPAKTSKSNGFAASRIPSVKMLICCTGTRTTISKSTT